MKQPRSSASLIAALILAVMLLAVGLGAHGGFGDGGHAGCPQKRTNSASTSG